MNKQLWLAAAVSAWAALSTPAFADATVTNGILSVLPPSAPQGTVGLTVAFNLSSNSIPPLPQVLRILPSGAKIGTNITAPAAGQPFYGQDAQCNGAQPSYTLSGDGLTVYDNRTGLTWQRTPDTTGDGSITASDKLTWTQAQTRPATLNAAHYGGFSDWRLPTIKELYSLIMFNGTDPSGLVGSDTSGLTPFINTNYFKFAYGDTGANHEDDVNNDLAIWTHFFSGSYGMPGNGPAGESGLTYSFQLNL